MVKINRAAFSRKKLQEEVCDKSALVQIGGKNANVSAECNEIVLWGYASGGKIRKGIYQFSIPVDMLVEFDHKNKRFMEGGKKILFAASLFSQMGHAIALFDWSEMVDRILLPKKGLGSVINFCVRKKRRSRFFCIKTRDFKLPCLWQTDWVKVRRRRRVIAN